MTAPSKKAIAKATGIALAVALLILFTAVLPAEYGIDPLKTGAKLGLTDLSKATEYQGQAHLWPRRRQRQWGSIHGHSPRSIKWTLKTWYCSRATEWRSNITCKKARAWCMPGKRTTSFV